MNAFFTTTGPTDADSWNILDRATAATGAHKIVSTDVIYDPLTTPPCYLGPVPRYGAPEPALHFGVLWANAYVEPGERAPSVLPETVTDFRPVISSSCPTWLWPLKPLDSDPYDVIIQSSNDVFFAVHSHILLAVSANRFCDRLPSSADARRAVSGEDTPYVLALPEDSTVLNVVLHTIYDLSYAGFPPGLAEFIAAVDVLKTYAVPLAPYLARGGSVYNYVLAKVWGPLDALEVFAFAAENALEDLAVAISPRVLCYGPDRIPDTLASRIGALYLQRLFALRERRRSAMRMLMTAPLFPHAPDRDCTIVDRQDVTCEWLLAAARVVWDFGPDISPSDMKLVMGSLSTSVCSDCRDSLAQQINDIVGEWELVKDTI